MMVNWAASPERVVQKDTRDCLAELCLMGTLESLGW